jgi:hypothetical protein
MRCLTEGTVLRYLFARQRSENSMTLGRVRIHLYKSESEKERKGIKPGTLRLFARVELRRLFSQL